MANFLKGEVPLVLADKREFTLVFDIEGFIAAESLYGKPQHQILAEASKGFMGATRALLFGAMQARHPEITAADAADILATNTMAIADAITSALDKALPDTAPNGAAGNAAAPAASPRRGKTSGANGARSASTRKRSGA